MLDEKLLAIILNLFYCLNAARLRNNRGECTYKVNVWHPSEDAEQKIRNLDYHWNNYTTYLTNELLMMKVASLNQIQQCQNTSNTIEKDMLQFRIQNERHKNDQLQFLHDVQTLKTKLDVVSKQTNSVKQELGRLRGRRGLRRHHSKRSKQLTLPKKDEGIELRNVVGNLKAEWLLMRRNLDSIQLENSNVKFGQNDFQTYINQIRQVLDGHETDIGRLFANQSRLNELTNRTIKQVKELTYNIEAQRDDRKLNNDTVDIAKTVNAALSKTYRLEKQLSDVTIENTLMKHLLLSLAKGENVTAKIEKQLEKSYRYGNNADAVKDDVKRLTTPRDCHDIYKLGYTVSGVYQIRPAGSPQLDDIYCQLINQSGWTVFQRRIDGSTNFNRRWLEYKYGFGNPYGEFWLGNEILHRLTRQGDYLLRIDIWDWEGNQAYAEYSHFKIHNEKHQYKLIVGGYHGNAGDSLSVHDSMSFSTEDVDNDHHRRHCAVDNKSGWWFNSCFYSNLNGVYHMGWYNTETSLYANSVSNGIVWFTWKDSEFYSLKKIEMKIKPVGQRASSN